MKLIFIYGPPAVGKLTVARALARHTHFHLFHNHLTVEVVKAVFPEHTATRTRLLEHLRLTMLRAAAKAGRDTIFTLAYSGMVDDVFVGRIVKAVNEYGGTVDFVQLHAPDDVLMRRVEYLSRRRLKKISNRFRLKKWLTTREAHATVKYPYVLKLDTVHHTAEEVAQAIVRHYKLMDHSGHSPVLPER